MRIPLPRRRKPEFKRKTSPPPAARKLLIASLSAGLLMMVALAIVFVPRGLQSEGLPPIPRITLSANTSTPVWRFVVTEATIVRPLSEYRAEWVRSGVVIASVAPLSDGAGNATLTFHDKDQDGQLSLGDEFDHVGPITYVGDALRIVYVPADAVCGYWPPAP